MSKYVRPEEYETHLILIFKKRLKILEDKVLDGLNVNQESLKTCYEDLNLSMSDIFEFRQQERKRMNISMKAKLTNSNQ